MPNFTTHLQLEKPTPEEFYDIGVQNGNMDKIDEDLTKRVPQTRTINKKPLSADVTLTGEDIPAGAEDATTLSSHLAECKKALDDKVPYIGQPLNNVAIATQITASLFGFNNTCPDDPYGGSSGVGITIPGWGNGVWGTQMAFDYNDRSPAFRQYYSYGQIVNPWIQLATATPPEVRDLTLQSGFENIGTCTFWKTQENVVTIAGGVLGTMPAETDTQIGTLIAGYSPPRPYRRAAVTNTGSAYIEIRVDGTVWVHPYTAAQRCFFNADFVAAGGNT